MTRGWDVLCHVKRLARLCAQETMRFLREEEHWEVGRGEGMQGQGKFQLGNDVMGGLGLWVRRELLSSLFESISNLSSSEIV